MKQAGVNASAIIAFKRCYEALASNQSFEINEETISPVSDLLELDKLDASDEFSADLLDKTVVIKLNGGLGTSMGLQKSKTLLNIRNQTTFLDVIVEQILHFRKSSGSKVKFLLMNSFNTSKDTLDFLEEYVDQGLGDPLECELLQNQIPKIAADSLKPAQYETNPEVEWCPPGHGDIYAALLGTGKLDELLSQGVKYAFVSNSDNLGATLNPKILSYFATSKKPFLMEVTRRTAADKKGGHLAVRNSDKQMLLREVAQTADEDLDSFQDIEKYRYFNTNNLWIRLDELKKLMDANNGLISLPVIKNNKTVDPRNSESAAVVQLEVAMGAAIECFEGADAICVPRSRFAPVKTTADLLALRSDAYEITEDSRVSLVPERKGKPPVITLSKNYKLVDSIESIGSPSLKEVTKLNVSGPVKFSKDVVLKGEVSFINESDDVKWIASGVYENETVNL